MEPQRGRSVGARLYLLRWPHSQQLWPSRACALRSGLRWPDSWSAERGSPTSEGCGSPRSWLGTSEDSPAALCLAVQHKACLACGQDPSQHAGPSSSLSNGGAGAPGVRIRAWTWARVLGGTQTGWREEAPGRERTHRWAGVPAGCALLLSLEHVDLLLKPESTSMVQGSLWDHILMLVPEALLGLDVGTDPGTRLLSWALLARTQPRNQDSSANKEYTDLHAKYLPHGMDAAGGLHCYPRPRCTGLFPRVLASGNQP